MTTLTNGTRTDVRVKAGASPPHPVESPPYRGTGWFLFAGIMLALVATLNLIWGRAAVLESGFFVADASASSSARRNASAGVAPSGTNAKSRMDSGGIQRC